MIAIFPPTRRALDAALASLVAGLVLLVAASLGASCAGAAGETTVVARAATGGAP